MPFSWSKKQVTTAVVSVVALLLTLGAWYVYHVQRELGVLRGELDALHAELSTVKPWAKSRLALAEAVAIVQSGHQAPNRFASSETQSPVQKTENQSAREYRYGQANAIFTLVIYSDLECPYCKQYNAVSKGLVDSSGGNVSLIFKHVPLHKEASRIESLAIECAGEQGGNSAFYKMLDAVFANTRGNGDGVNQPLPAIAAGLGLNSDQLRECVDTDRYMPKLSSDLQEASRLGIDKTPTTVVRNNKTGRSQVIPGTSTPEVLMQAMASLVDQ